MKAVLVLALMAVSVSAAGPIPMVILRPEGESTYATCTPQTCLKPEPVKPNYAAYVFIAAGCLCLSSVYLISKALSRERRLISR